MLEKHAPEVCAELDAQMIEYGQTWVTPRMVTYLDDDLLTADQVAEYCDVTLKTVYMWRAQRGMPSISTRDGIRFVFKEVRAWKNSR
jgi:excisionase family DNA binding protein